MDSGSMDTSLGQSRGSKRLDLISSVLAQLDLTINTLVSMHTVNATIHSGPIYLPKTELLQMHGKVTQLATDPIENIWRKLKTLKSPLKVLNQEEFKGIEMKPLKQEWALSKYKIN
ncbi:hypothetical protein H5410_035769 [Solanum commersonii]|uniref:Uncharacterized protein n=1 Tax=Solanum commersonii TaxID=4109 RepID=A0A9J5Y286_SOLCO|nr:hypothetical protein H5410_035769 [Solanum commersonii]